MTAEERDNLDRFKSAHPKTRAMTLLGIPDTDMTENDLRWLARWLGDRIHEASKEGIFV